MKVFLVTFLGVEKEGGKAVIVAESASELQAILLTELAKEKTGRKDKIFGTITEIKEVNSLRPQCIITDLGYYD